MRWPHIDQKSPLHKRKPSRLLFFQPLIIFRGVFRFGQTSVNDGQKVPPRTPPIQIYLQKFQPAQSHRQQRGACALASRTKKDQS